MSTGNRIKVLREARKWTLEDLSDRSGVDVGTINALERRNSRRSVHFPALARAFGMTMEQLTEGLEPPDTAIEDAVEASIQKGHENIDRWQKEGEEILKMLNPIQRAQMVSNMRSYKRFLDRA